MFLKSLSGRFLLLTILFILLAEVLIFVPSIAGFRQDFLQARLQRAQIAALSVLATMNDEVEPELRKELLREAGVLNVVMRRNETRELVLAADMPAMIEDSFDLRDESPWVLIHDALETLMLRGQRIILVVGAPTNGAGLLIEVAMSEEILFDAMRRYCWNILLLSLVISGITGALLFVAVRIFLVRPISRVVRQIKVYETAPEDARRIIQPQAGITELYEAEEALQSMQTQLHSSLRQKDRLATLGSGVSKISHDLRNILTTAQLIADTMERSDDPKVKRRAPKLVRSIARAIHLSERTLVFGKAEEPLPEITRFPMRIMLEDVVEGELLALGDAEVSIVVDMEKDIEMAADQEQIHRVVSNLVRNARQVLTANGKPGLIKVGGAEKQDFWCISVSDNGPGLPEKARGHLFEPFQGGARQGGTGLGLAISAELIAGHGGKLELVDSTPQGTQFLISLPKQVA